MHPNATRRVWSYILSMFDNTFLLQGDQNTLPNSRWNLTIPLFVNIGVAESAPHHTPVNACIILIPFLALMFFSICSLQDNLLLRTLPKYSVWLVQSMLLLFIFVCFGATFNFIVLWKMMDPNFSSVCQVVFLQPWLHLVQDLISSYDQIPHFIPNTVFTRLSAYCKIFTPIILNLWNERMYILKRIGLKVDPCAYPLLVYLRRILKVLSLLTTSALCSFKFRIISHM